MNKEEILIENEKKFKEYYREYCKKGSENFISDAFYCVVSTLFIQIYDSELYLDQKGFERIESVFYLVFKKRIEFVREKILSIVNVIDRIVAANAKSNTEFKIIVDAFVKSCSSICKEPINKIRRNIMIVEYLKRKFSGNKRIHNESIRETSLLFNIEKKESSYLHTIALKELKLEEGYYSSTYAGKVANKYLNNLSEEYDSLKKILISMIKEIGTDNVGYFILLFNGSNLYLPDLKEVITSKKADR